MALRCPLCESSYVRRAHRKGLLEQLLSVVYVYPFRCQLCTHRFLTLQWGIRYSKQEDLRQYERIGVRFPVEFGGPQTTGKGFVTDISVADCAIETPLPLKAGDVLKLALHAKSGRPPIVVEKAAIRSVRPGTVGVQFVEVSEADRARLHRLIGEMVGAWIAPVSRPQAPASVPESMKETPR
jgi:hypothetical protein